MSDGKEHLDEIFEDALDAAVSITHGTGDPTHRCRIYQLRRNTHGAVFEMWDTLEQPHPRPPEREPIHTVEDSSLEKIRQQMMAFMEEHDIVSFGQRDGRTHR